MLHEVIRIEDLHIVKKDGTETFCGEPLDEYDDEYYYDDDDKFPTKIKKSELGLLSYLKKLCEEKIPFEDLCGKCVSSAYFSSRE